MSVVSVSRCARIADETQAEPDWRASRRLTWVAESTRPIAVRVDSPPSGVVRGAVVVVPSLGPEAVASYRTVRSLAVRAARAGFVACTFSLSGDGDSADLPRGVDAVNAWVEDVRAVRALAARITGGKLPVHLVGLRLGGAIVERLHTLDTTALGSFAAGAESTGQGANTTYVAWEPVSGTAFLRHHTQLRASGVPGEPVAEGVEIDGLWLADETVASLRGLRATRRTERAVTENRGGLRFRFEKDRRSAARLALGAPYFAHVPLAGLDEIVASLPAGAPREAAAWEPVCSVRMPVQGADGATHWIEESWIEVGAGRVPGIVSSCDAVETRAGLVTSAMGSEVRWGPGRVWTTAARELAVAGVVTLRADRAGIGDDVDPDYAREPLPYTEAAAESVADAVTALRAMVLPDVPVSVAGACAGAWNAVRAAALVPVEQVVAVNQVHWHPDSSVYTRAFFDHYHGSEAAGVDNPASPPTLGSLLRDPRRARARLQDFVMHEVAVRLPWLRAAMRPEVPNERVAAMTNPVPVRTELHLVLGAEEGRIFTGKGGRAAVARRRRRGGVVSVAQPDGLDHSLLSERSRRDVVALVHRILVGAAPTSA